MLCDSKPSTSESNPLPIAESSEDWNIVSLIICGRAHYTTSLHRSWSQVARLYEISKKYQFDSYQPWFTEMCLNWLHESPLDALALACNQPEIDEVLAQHAILALWRVDHNALYQANPVYFRGPAFSPTYHTFSPDDLKRWLLDVNNVTLKLGVALGYKGSLAYSFAFAGLGAGVAGRVDSLEDWQAQATKFMFAIKEIERHLGGYIVSRISRGLCRATDAEYYRTPVCPSVISAQRWDEIEDGLPTVWQAHLASCESSRT